MQRPPHPFPPPAHWGVVAVPGRLGRPVTGPALGRGSNASGSKNAGNIVTFPHFANPASPETGVHLEMINPSRDFPGGTVVKSLPANTGDTGSIPGPGRSHMRQSN